MRSKRGFILVFALVIIMLVILSLAALFVISYNDLVMSNTIIRGMRAYYIAEAGLAQRFMDMRSQDPPVGGTLGPTPFALVGGDSGTYSTTVTPVAVGTLSTYRVDSVGLYKNISRQVSITVTQRSYSSFAYLTNLEGQLFWWGQENVWFTSRDRLTGPLHSNDQFNIFGDPIFEGPVSSVSNSINYYHGGPPDDNPEFRGSLTLGALGIQMPSTANMLTPISTSVQSAYSYGGRTDITFLADGTMNVYNVGKYGSNITNVALPANGLIYVSGGNANVQGTVNGSVTIGCANDINIVGNILYNTDPRDDSTSSDMLGLVASNSVVISASAPNDLEVDAYIVAINSSFKVADSVIDNYIVKEDLVLYGGITQSTRGAMGTFYTGSGDKASGYTKDYEYDPRLLSASPVSFPAAKDADGRILYRKVTWSETT
ncbi:MAG: hypothetical protein PHX20_00685 [Candidatus Omnitrophica bacterium]|nr:hypothetical protein [Candidatus Omnitrophota bacterium]MDD5436049.1 hypothetical protein [Candidatus Omnitrophota bacterium]